MCRTDGRRCERGAAAAAAAAPARPAVDLFTRNQCDPGTADMPQLDGVHGVHAAGGAAERSRLAAGWSAVRPLRALSRKQNVARGFTPSWCGRRCVQEMPP